MTTLALTRTQTVQEKAKLPFALAFGCILAVSSTISASAPSGSWSMTSAEGSPQLRVVATAGGTSSGQIAKGATPRLSAEPARQVTELRILSGLTTDQVAKLMGVTRRSIHNWIGGSAMTRQNQQRVAELLSLVRSLPADTPEGRRDAVLDSSGGRSLFHRLLENLTQGSRVQSVPVTARERIAL